MKAARFSETSEVAYYPTRGENQKGHHLSNQALKTVQLKTRCLLGQKPDRGLWTAERLHPQNIRFMALLFHLSCRHPNAIFNGLHLMIHTYTTYCNMHFAIHYIHFFPMILGINTCYFPPNNTNPLVLIMDTKCILQEAGAVVSLSLSCYCLRQMSVCKQCTYTPQMGFVSCLKIETRA